MMGPKHISELLPGVIDRIAQAHGYTTGKAPEAVQPGDPRAPNTGGAPRSTGDSPATPAGDGRDASQDRVGAQAEGLTIELPFPPSVNTYWRHITIGKRARTLISEKGRNYKQAVHEHFLVDNITTVLRGPLACTLDMYPPCNRRRDCDNYCKGLLDALGSAGLYDDDSQIVDLHIRMHPKRAPGSVRVILSPISAPQSAHNQVALCI